MVATVEVGVKIGKGVWVAVGVNVGGSGVNVNVGVAVISNVGVSVSSNAFWVNPAITVWAAAVLMLPGSGVAIPGTEQAAVADSRTAIKM
jgi:hypothetical protein